jgi:hypothetical protein
MKSRFILTLCIVSITILAQAQSKVSRNDMVGSWHVALVKMYDGAVYCDLDNDSVNISDEMKQKWKNAQDSAIAMAMSVGMLKAFQGMHMLFGADGSYEEKDKKNSRKGNYVFDDSSSVVTINYAGTTTSLKARLIRDKNFVMIEPLNAKGDMQMYPSKD